MGNITINDIAKISGVAKSTVSRVLNGATNVSDETREKVLKVIEENKYQPSAVARGLSTNETNVIGVIVPNSSSVFWGQVLEGVSEIAARHNCTVLFCVTNNNWKCEQAAIKRMRGERVKGLLITPSIGYTVGQRGNKKNFFQDLEDLRCPVVFIDRSIRNSKWSGVYFDNYNGAYMATDKLIQKGFKNIGALISDQNLQIGQDRKEGFLTALEDAGITPNSEVIYYGDTQISLRDAYELTEDWIQTKKLPEAVFLSGAMIANGFFKALIRHGLVPGKDVVCVGFDYVEVLDILNLDYSYIERDAADMGRIAARMLFEDNDGDKRDHIIRADLILGKALQ